jgi:hypothetical protein
MMTQELTARESMIQVYSDFHKDAYGFRPRGINYDAMSLEDLEADFARFAEVCEENAKAEAEYDRIKAAEFWNRISELKQMGARTKATALRWMADAGVEVDYDLDYYLYTIGLSKYEPGGRKIYDALLPYWGRACEAYYARTKAA